MIAGTARPLAGDAGGLDGEGQNGLPKEGPA
jgi:hypothetical protein